MCVDGAGDMGKSSARTHGQGEYSVVSIVQYSVPPSGHLSSRPPLTFMHNISRYTIPLDLLEMLQLLAGFSGMQDVNILYV